MFGTESGALMFGPGICGGGGAYVVIGLVGYKSVAFYSCASVAQKTKQEADEGKRWEEYEGKKSTQSGRCC